MAVDDGGAAAYSDWLYWRMCGRKLEYETLRDASKSVIEQNRRARRQGRGRFWRPYQCSFCAKYHLTCEAVVT